MENNLSEQCRQELKSQPESVIMTVAVDAAIGVLRMIDDLVDKYEAAGVEVIPISEIKNIRKDALKRALGNGGLLKKLLK